MTGRPRTNSNCRDTDSEADRDEVIEVLERVREQVHNHLERIAALAATGLGEREQALLDRVAELEGDCERATAEWKRHQAEWDADMKRLEADRRLLADAWDEIERERIASRALAETAPSSSSALGPAAEVPNRPRAAAGEDPITRAMLQQFQALKQDVRRNATARRSGT